MIFAGRYVKKINKNKAIRYATHCIWESILVCNVNYHPINNKDWWREQRDTTALDSLGHNLRNGSNKLDSIPPPACLNHSFAPTLLLYKCILNVLHAHVLSCFYHKKWFIDSGMPWECQEAQPRKRSLASVWQLIPGWEMPQVASCWFLRSF